MLNSIRYNLSHLTDFAGRDARQTFWFYILFLVIVQFGIGLLSSIPLYAGMVGQIVDAVRSGAAESDPNVIAAGMVDNMGGYIRMQAWVGAVVGIVMIGLVLAAFVRRLHDAGFSGWIAIVPAVTQLFAVIYNIAVIDDVLAAMDDMMVSQNGAASAMAMQADVAPYAAVGWIGYLVVIGFGVLKSQDGPNRYGDGPVRH